MSTVIFFQIQNTKYFYFYKILRIIVYYPFAYPSIPGIYKSAFTQLCFLTGVLKGFVLTGSSVTFLTGLLGVFIFLSVSCSCFLAVLTGFGAFIGSSFGIGCGNSS